MKKIAGIALCAALFCSANGIKGQIFNVKAEKYSENQVEMIQVEQVNASQGLQIRGKACYLMDCGSKTVIHAQNERERLPIASMCKIMTLLLSFEALERGDFQLDDEICVSERAASMGGSQVFLEANAKYSVKELIKSIWMH